MDGQQAPSEQQQQMQPADNDDDSLQQASPRQSASMSSQQQQEEVQDLAAVQQQAHAMPRAAPDAVSSCTGLVVRNRGSLAAAADAKRQQHLSKQQQLVQEWQGFAERQAQRYVPAPPNPASAVLQESTCHRLRVLHVDNLPPPQLDSGILYGLQLGVTLFDHAVGQYYGSTCWSLVELLQGEQQRWDSAEEGAAGADTNSSSGAPVDFSFDVFFHSTVADANCMAVVELVLVELDEDGSSRTKCSAGWAQVPLFARKGPAATALLNAQLAGGQSPGSAPVMSGTPRYLQLRAICGDQLPPPAVLGSCMVAYQVEAYPAMNPARPLLPQDFLVSYTDVIPGLRRFDLVGQPSTALHSTLNTLASPLLADLCAVSMHGVQLVVPQLLHNLLSVLPELLGAVPPPDLATMLSVPCQPDAVAYSMRARVHNGRTFVGPWVTAPLQAQPHLGSLLLGPPPGHQLCIDWLLQDRLAVLVLELLAAPSGVSDPAQGAHGAQVLVGRSVLAPFDEVAAESAAASVLATSQHKLVFDSSSCLGSLGRSSCWAPSSGCSISMLAAGGGAAAGDLLLPLNWRAMLGNTAIRAVPDPSVQLELQPCGRAPQLPGTAIAAAAGNTASSSAPDNAPARASTVQAACAHVSTVAHAAQVSCVEPASPAAGAAVTAVEQGMFADTSQGPAKSLGRESPAARSVQLAAHHLEEAANIPVQTPSATQCGGGGHSECGADSQVDAASRQQLQQLANAMQQQLDLLANAVAELRQERQTLRSSLTMLESAAAPAGQHTRSMLQQHAGAAPHPAMQQQPQQAQHNGSPGVAAAAADCAWLSRVPETAHGDPACFSGEVLQQSYQGLTPSRAVLQQLHEAGMLHALPADVQARLQAQSNLSLHQQHPQQQSGRSHTSRTAALLLDVEARDPRTASQVVLQLLSFRPAPAAGAVTSVFPSSLCRMYFTLQFYKSGPVVTDTCLLAASPQGQHMQGGGGCDSAAGMQSPDTFLLLPQQQQGGGGAPAGAGVVLKFSVDGSKPSELLPGQDPLQAAAAAHLAFCRFLVGHKLAVDLWDGDLLLQLGSCTADLSGLLRQGRDLSDLLLELPVLRVPPDGQPGSTGPVVPALAPSKPTSKPQGAVQLGTLVLRLINMGQEPGHVAGAAAAVAAASTPGTPSNKVCLRAAPLQPGSLVAKELRGGSSSPFAVDWSQQHSGSGAGAGDGGPQALDVSASTDAAQAAADIIGLEQRKLAREQKLRDLLHSPSSSPKHSTPGALQWHSYPGKAPFSPAKGQQQQQQQWRPGSPLLPRTAAAEGGSGGDVGAVEPYKALQQQLLSDVDAVRKRQKPDFIRSQLRKNLVTQCSIRASPGQALLLEHNLTNSIGRDAVFELRVSHPQELRAVESLEELRDLQQADRVAVISTTAAAAAAAGPASPAKGATAAAAGRMDASPLQLRQLAHQAAAAATAGGGGVAAAGGRQLVNRGRICLGANESVVIPLRYLLQCDAQSSAPGPGSGSKQLVQLKQRQRTVVVEFVPLGLDWPVSILEVAVQPEPAVVDRTLRYHCPERELLHVEVSPADLPGASGPLLAAAAAGRLTVAASRADVGVSVLSNATGEQQTAAGPNQQQQQQQQRVCLRYRCGDAREAVQFTVWLYGSTAMGQPLEAWQVFVQPLQRVDMRATVGQHSSTTLAVAGGSVDRLVAAYSSAPGELQTAPGTLSLPAGGMSALGLVFTPRSLGQQRVRVHLVDVNSRQLVHALLVCTDAQLPPIHRQMEVRVHAGAVSQHQLEVANTTNRASNYLTTTNTPGLLSVTPNGPQHIPAAGRRLLGLVCDARGLAAGSTVTGLVFVADAQDSLRHEECVLVTVHVV